MGQPSKFTLQDNEVREHLNFIASFKNRVGFPASLKDRYKAELVRAAEERGHKYPNVASFEELENWLRHLLAV